MASLLSRITWEDWRVTGVTAVALLAWYGATRTLLLPAIYGGRPAGDRNSEVVSAANRAAAAGGPSPPMLPRRQVKRWRKDMSRARSWLLTLPISIALTVAGAVPAAIIFGHYALG
jgi:hypothetical protein